MSRSVTNDKAPQFDDCIVTMLIVISLFAMVKYFETNTSNSFETITQFSFEPKAVNAMANPICYAFEANCSIFNCWSSGLQSQ